MSQLELSMVEKLGRASRGAGLNDKWQMANGKTSAPDSVSSFAIGHSSPRGGVRRRGIVILVVLLALIFLLALIVYVLNIGRAVEARTEVQSAADAGAVSGPGYFARGMNTVAMSNTGIAQLLGLVNNLDAAPTTIDHTLKDQTMVLESLNQQLSSGVPEADLRAEIVTLRDAVQREVEWLTETDQVLQGINVDRFTHWNGPTGRGEMWRAMQNLQVYAEATAENLGTLSQVAAVHSVEANLLAADRGASGVMLPVVPDVPFEVGAFDDFEYPVRYGQLPAATRDPEVRRGPWDTVYGWRDGWYFVTLESLTRSGGAGGSGSGQSGWSGRGGGFGSNWRVTSRTLLQYATFGPHAGIVRHLAGSGDELVILSTDGLTATGFLNRRLRRPMSGGAHAPTLDTGTLVPGGGDGVWGSHLPWSRIDAWHRQIANIKASMCWPARPPYPAVINPEWISDRSRAIVYAQTPTAVIRETAYARIIFIEVQENGRPTGPRTHSDTDLIWARGWHPSPPGLTDTDKIAEHIWYDPVVDVVVLPQPNGGELTRTTTFHNYFIWLGANRGEPEDLDNPYEGLARDAAPRPVDLDHDGLPVESDNRHEALTFLTAARRSTASALMPTRFDDGRADTHTVAFSQSVVFNNHSRDLWTQMWRVQLEPVDQYGAWASLLDGSGPQIGAIPVLDDETVAEVQRHLRAAEAVADEMLRH